MMMRTTIDIPDELFRRAKAEAAMRGLEFEDLVTQGLQRELASSDVPEPAAPPPVTLHDLMRKYCGIVDSGIDDLASNPKHMEGFGHASMGDR